MNVSSDTDMYSARAGSSLALTAKLFRGLGDLSRLRVLATLRDGPVSAGEIVTRAGLSQPTASMHLKWRVRPGDWEREGKFVYYEIADKRAVQLLDQAEELLLQVAP